MFNFDTIILGYYPTWEQAAFPPERIDFGHLTHVACASARPSPNGTIAPPKNFAMNEFVCKVHRAGAKVIISVDGPGSPAAFSIIAADEALRTAFAANLTSFCLDNNFDGADLDWEAAPVGDQMNQCTALCALISSHFRKASRHLTLSITVPRLPVPKDFDYVNLAEKVDWIGLMTYDFAKKRYAEHNAPMSKVIEYVCNYLPSNPPKQKLLLGIPFYGYRYQCAVEPELGAPAQIVAYPYKYSEAVTCTGAEWEHKRDCEEHVPYLINRTTQQLVSYDDEASIGFKCQWLKKHGMGGALTWALSYDAINGDQPLLKVVGTELLSPQM